MIPLIWVAPALFAAVVVLNQTSASAPPPQEPQRAPEPPAYGTMKLLPPPPMAKPVFPAPAQAPAHAPRPRRQKRSRMSPGLDFGDEPPKKPKRRARNTRPAKAPRLANVLELPLADATEAARLKFKKGPVRSVTAGDQEIVVEVDPSSTDMLMVPPAYLGWKVRITDQRTELRELSLDRSAATDKTGRQESRAQRPKSQVAK